MRMSANLTAQMNGTQALSFFNPMHEATRIGLTFYHCLIFVVSLIGNIIIGIIVYRTKSMQNPSNFFIANMAMSDLILPIFHFPYFVTKINFGWLTSGPLGQALCKLVFFLPDTSCLVSIQSLVLIAVDRFGAVFFPLRSSLISSKQCWLFILATWIIGAAVHIPHLLSFKLVENQEGLSCEHKWNDAFGDSSSFRNYAVPMLVVFWLAPMVLIAVLYMTVFFKLKSQRIPGEKSANARALRLRRERNVLKMSIAIVLTFAVCWLPNTIGWFLFFYPSHGDMTASRGFHYFIVISILLRISNCAINPCICCIFSGNYRQGLKKLLRCCPACNRANQVAA